jgi:hypothetical protein
MVDGVVVSISMGMIVVVIVPSTIALTVDDVVSNLIALIRSTAVDGVEELSKGTHTSWQPPQ